MVKLADTLALGASARKSVEVQILSPAKITFVWDLNGAAMRSSADERREPGLRKGLATGEALSVVKSSPQHK